MRKLKLQMQMSIDGFIAGPNGELDWMVRNWDYELKKYVFNLTRPVDCIILGKNLADIFIPTWQRRLKNAEKTSDSFAKKMNDTPKIVFSRSMNTTTWKNTRIAKGTLTDEILNLKKMKGRDIIVYGGASFVKSLIKAGLIDEYNLFINPVVIGKGISIFNEIEDLYKMNLVYSTSFDCGITSVCYIPQKNSKVNEARMIWNTDSSAGS